MKRKPIRIPMKKNCNRSQTNFGFLSIFGKEIYFMDTLQSIFHTRIDLCLENEGLFLFALCFLMQSACEVFKFEAILSY